MSLLFFLITTVIRITTFAIKVPFLLYTGFVRFISWLWMYKILIMLVIALSVPALFWGRYHDIGLEIAEKTYSCTIRPLIRDVLAPLARAIDALWKIVIRFTNFYFMIQRKFLFDLVAHLAVCKGTYQFVEELFASIQPLSRALILLIRMLINTIGGVMDDGIAWAVVLVGDSLGNLLAVGSSIVDCYCSMLRILTDTLALILVNDHLHCALANYIRVMQRGLAAIIDSVVNKLAPWLGDSFFPWLISGGTYPLEPFSPDMLPDPDPALDAMIAGQCCLGDLADDLVRSVIEFLWQLVEELFSVELGIYPRDIRIGGILRGIGPVIVEAQRLLLRAVTARFDRIREDSYYPIIDALEYWAIEMRDAMATFSYRQAMLVGNLNLGIVRLFKLLLEVIINVRSYDDFKELDWNCTLRAFHDSFEYAYLWIGTIFTYLDYIPDPFGDWSSPNITDIPTMFDGEIPHFVTSLLYVPLELVKFAIDITTHLDSVEDFRTVSSDCFFQSLTNVTDKGVVMIEQILKNIPPISMLRLIPGYTPPFHEIPQVLGSSINLLVETFRLIFVHAQHGNFDDWEFDEADTDVFIRAWEVWATDFGRLVGHHPSLEEAGEVLQQLIFIIVKFVAFLVRIILHPTHSYEVMFNDLLCQSENATLKAQAFLSDLDVSVDIPLWDTQFNFNIVSLFRSVIMIMLKLLEILNKLLIEIIRAVDDDPSSFRLWKIEGAIGEMTTSLDCLIDQFSLGIGIMNWGIIDTNISDGIRNLGYAIVDVLRFVFGLIFELTKDDGNYASATNNITCAANHISQGLAHIAQTPISLIGRLAALISGGDPQVEDAFQRLTSAVGRLTQLVSAYVVHVIHIVVRSIMQVSGAGDEGENLIDLSGLVCVINETPNVVYDVIIAMDFTESGNTCEMAEFAQALANFTTNFPKMILQLIIDGHTTVFFDTFVQLRSVVIKMGNLFGWPIESICVLAGTHCQTEAGALGDFITALLNIFVSILETIVRIIYRVLADAFGSLFDLSDIIEPPPDPGTENPYMFDLRVTIYSFITLLKGIAGIFDLFLPEIADIFIAIARMVYYLFLSEESLLSEVVGYLFDIIVGIIKFFVELFTNTSNAWNIFMDVLTNVGKMFLALFDFILQIITYIIDDVIFSWVRIGDYGIVGCLTHFGDCVRSIFGFRSTAASLAQEFIIASTYFSNDTLANAEHSQCQRILHAAGTRLLDSIETNPNMTETELLNMINYMDKLQIALCINYIKDARSRSSGPVGNEYTRMETYYHSRGPACIIQEMESAIQFGKFVSDGVMRSLLFNNFSFYDQRDIKKSIRDPLPYNETYLAVSKNVEPLLNNIELTDERMLFYENLINSVSNDIKQTFQQFLEHNLLGPDQYERTTDVLRSLDTIKRKTHLSPKRIQLAYDATANFIQDKATKLHDSLKRGYKKAVANYVITDEKSFESRWGGIVEPGCGHGDPIICAEGDEECLEQGLEGCPDYWGDDCMDDITEIPPMCPVPGGGAVGGNTLTTAQRACYHICDDYSHNWFFDYLCEVERDGTNAGKYYKHRNNKDAENVGVYDGSFWSKDQCYQRSINGRANPDFCKKCDMWIEDWPDHHGISDEDEIAILWIACVGLCPMPDRTCSKHLSQNQMIRCKKDLYAYGVCERYGYHNHEPTGARLDQRLNVPDEAGIFINPGFSKVAVFSNPNYDGDPSGLWFTDEQPTAFQNPVFCYGDSMGSSGECDNVNHYYVVNWTIAADQSSPELQNPNMNVLEFFCPNTGRYNLPFTFFDDIDYEYISNNLICEPPEICFDSSNPSAYVTTDWCAELCGAVNEGENCQYLLPIACYNYLSYTGPLKASRARREFCKMFQNAGFLPPNQVISEDLFPLRGPGYLAETGLNPPYPTPGYYVSTAAAHACPNVDGWPGTGHSCFMLGPDIPYYQSYERILAGMPAIWKYRIGMIYQIHLANNIDFDDIYKEYLYESRDLHALELDYELIRDLYNENQDEPRLKYTAPRYDPGEDPIANCFDLLDIECSDNECEYPVCYELWPTNPRVLNLTGCGIYPCPEEIERSPCEKAKNLTHMPTFEEAMTTEPPSGGPDDIIRSPFRTTFTDLLLMDDDYYFDIDQYLENRRQQRRLGEQQQTVINRQIFQYVRRWITMQMCERFPHVNECKRLNEVSARLTEEYRRDYGDPTWNTSVLPPPSEFRWDCYYLCGYNWTGLLDRSCLFNAIGYTGPFAAAVKFISLIPGEFCELVDMGDGSEYLYGSVFEVFTDLVNISGILNKIYARDNEPPEASASVSPTPVGLSGKLSMITDNILECLGNLITRIVTALFGETVANVISSGEATTEYITDLLTNFFLAESTTTTNTTSTAIRLIRWITNFGTDRNSTNGVGLYYWATYLITPDCYKLECGDKLFGVFPIWSPWWGTVFPTCLFEQLTKIFEFLEWPVGKHILPQLVLQQDPRCFNVTMFGVPYTKFCDCDDVVYANCRDYGFRSPLDGIAFLVTWIYPDFYNSGMLANIIMTVTRTESNFAKFVGFQTAVPDDGLLYKTCFFIQLIYNVTVGIMPFIGLALLYELFHPLIMAFIDLVDGIMIAATTTITLASIRAQARAKAENVRSELYEEIESREMERQEEEEEEERRRELLRRRQQTFRTISKRKIP